MRRRPRTLRSRRYVFLNQNSCSWECSTVKYFISGEVLNGLQEDGRDAVWVPPKVWTAWPLRERHLPAEGLIKREEDDDEQFTLRKEEQKMPSSGLQEELGALILRTAKKRFLKRKRKTVHQSVERDTSEEEEEEEETPAPSPPNTSVKAESRAGSEMMDLDDNIRTRTRNAEPKTYEPVVSADDELSYRILQPSVRHILSRLDKTLNILHHTRVAGIGYASDDTTSEDESETQSERSKGRSRGRPRRASQPDDDIPSKPKASKRGRPRKVHVPQEGESHEEMLLRIARESHRRLPPQAVDKAKKPKEAGFTIESKEASSEDEPEEMEHVRKNRSGGFTRVKGPSRATLGSNNKGFLEWLRKGDEQIELERKRREEEQEMIKVEKRLARLGVRDWSDVVGAAALAGFSDDVIARTTKRCADLFGEGMVLRRLDEVPAAHGTGVRSVSYRPEQIQLSDSAAEASSSSDDDTAATLVQRRIASRQATLARSSHESGSDSVPRGRRASTPSHSQSRSRSRSSAGQFFCPVASCERAANGFSRRPNLLRHMELVHPGRREAEDVDSDDEVVGAVHVDGFLKTIATGQGWRGEDAATRKRKSHYKGRRARSDSSD